jgi:hypothetical protein
MFIIFVVAFLLMLVANGHSLSDMAVFENRKLVTAVKVITKSSLFILVLGVIRRLELKLIGIKQRSIDFAQDCSRLFFIIYLITGACSRSTKSVVYS